jgi:hypothetical protein
VEWVGSRFPVVPIVELHAGRHVTVYEQAKAFMHVSAGINFTPNAVKALNGLGNRQVGLPLLREIYQSNDSQTAAALDTIAQRGVGLSSALLNARPARPGLPEIDPRMLHVALLGACTFFATAQPLFDVLFAKSTDEALAEQYAQFLTDLLLRGLGVEARTGQANS